MKNELMLRKQNVMRRNIIIYLMIFAALSLIYKAMNEIAINLKTSTMEIYILIMSLVMLTIQSCRTMGLPVKDEKIIKDKCLINRIGFHVILWGGILMHFVSNLIYNIWTLTYSNTFISIVILVGFLVAVLGAKKQGFYINNSFIEMTTKKYLTRLAKNIGKLWLIAIGYATVIYSLSLTLQIQLNIVTVVWSYILLSTILFSIFYLLFSIYEKIDYDEKMILTTRDERPYLSKKVILLGLPLIGYSIITSGVSFLYWQSRLNGNLAGEGIFESLNQLLLIWTIDFAVIGLLLSFVIYKSIKSLPNEKPNLFKYFPILIWMNFVYALGISSITIYNTLHPGYFSLNFMEIIGDISLYISYGASVIVLLIHIYFYSYLKSNHFPAVKTFLIVPIFPILSHISRIVIFNLRANANNTIYQIYLAAFILTVVTALLYYFIYCRMSNDLYIATQPLLKREESKVILNKKLIH